ncbi:MAG: hypothetical protein GEV00_22030, partial [Actinophytocola sp.]|nr:hypothetical protein [Actinophytocola sp.]
MFPVASPAVLADLVAEFKASGPTYQRTVKTTLKASYTNHYRTGLIKRVQVLGFSSNNTVHRPVLEALELISRYATAGNLHYYPVGEHVPVHRGLSGDWEGLVYKEDKRRRQRVVRMVYEVCTFQALREQLRCKEIWVDGADKWRNPAEDLPAEFEERRVEHYQALRKPLDPTEFIDGLREEMRAELDALHQALPNLDWLSISERRSGAIKLTPFEAAPEPRNLRNLKATVATRWGTVPLIDMLKEAVLRTGCLEATGPRATPSPARRCPAAGRQCSRSTRPPPYWPDLRHAGACGRRVTTRRVRISTRGHHRPQHRLAIPDHDPARRSERGRRPRAGTPRRRPTRGTPPGPRAAARLRPTRP